LLPFYRLTLDARRRSKVARRRYKGLVTGYKGIWYLQDWGGHPGRFWKVHVGKQ
jgi:hypothetical protein